MLLCHLLLPSAPESSWLLRCSFLPSPCRDTLPGMCLPEGPALLLGLVSCPTQAPLNTPAPGALRSGALAHGLQPQPGRLPTQGRHGWRLLLQGSALGHRRLREAELPFTSVYFICEDPSERKQKKSLFEEYSVAHRLDGELKNEARKSGSDAGRPTGCEFSLVREPLDTGSPLAPRPRHACCGPMTRPRSLQPRPCDPQHLVVTLGHVHRCSWSPVSPAKFQMVVGSGAREKKGRCQQASL